MKMKTNQQIFDHAWKFFKDGTPRCSKMIDGIDNCVYYAKSMPKGCVIGSMLTEVDRINLARNPLAIGYSATCLLANDLPMMNRNGLDQCHSSILSQLQSIHDNKVYWEDDVLSSTGYVRLREIAARFDLTEPE